MAKAKVTLRYEGIGQLLRSKEMAAEMNRRGQAVADRAGDGFVCETVIGRTRARAMIFPTTVQALLRERKDKVLTRAIDAARG